MTDDDLYETVAWHINGREFIYRRRSDGVLVKATQHACGRATQIIGESFVTHAQHLQQWHFPAVT